jgi:hypothetical protein
MLRGTTPDVAARRHATIRNRTLEANGRHPLSESDARTFQSTGMPAIHAAAAEEIGVRKPRLDDVRFLSLQELRDPEKRPEAEGDERARIECRQFYACRVKHADERVIALNRNDPRMETAWIEAAHHIDHHPLSSRRRCGR